MGFRVFRFRFISGLGIRFGGTKLCFDGVKGMLGFVTRILMIYGFMVWVRV